MRVPSIKLQNAIANMVANGGNMAKSLRDAGYSEAIARNPAKIFTLERMEAFRNTSVFNLDAAFRTCLKSPAILKVYEIPQRYHPY